MSLTPPPQESTPFSATRTGGVTLDGKTLKLGRVKLRHLEDALGAMEIMRTMQPDTVPSRAHVHSMLMVVHASAVSIDPAMTFSAVQSFFYDADVDAIDSLKALAEAYNIAQELGAPKVKEAKEAPAGEAIAP